MFPKALTIEIKLKHSTLLRIKNGTLKKATVCNWQEASGLGGGGLLKASCKRS